MKEIKYISTNIGLNPANPLVDIHPDCQQWIYTEIARSMKLFSQLNQQKNELWTLAVKRYPKRFSMGQNGPNSLFSILAGILGNYHEQSAKYNGRYRFSLRQLEDLELAFIILSHLDNSFESFTLTQTLFHKEHQHESSIN